MLAGAVTTSSIGFLVSSFLRSPVAREDRMCDLLAAAFLQVPKAADAGLWPSQLEPTL